MLVLTDAAAPAHAPVRRRPCSLPSAGSRGRRHWTRPARRCAPADGPISMRNRTDLDASFNRSRCGVRPISMRSTTDLDAEYDRSRRKEGAARAGRQRL